MPLYPPAASGGALTVLSNTQQDFAGTNLEGTGSAIVVAQKELAAGSYILIGMLNIEDTGIANDNELAFFCPDPVDLSTAYSGTQFATGDTANQQATCTAIALITLAESTMVDFCWYGGVAVGGTPASVQTLVGGSGAPATQFVAIKYA